MAFEIELGGRAFYQRAAADSSDETLRALFGRFAVMEGEHMETLSRRYHVEAPDPSDAFRVELAAILITHHHSDHNLEFGNLIHTAWTAGLATPVAAWGPVGLERMTRAFLDLNRFDIETRIADEGRPDLSGLIETHDYTEGLVFDDGTVRVSALRNHHPPVVDSFALRFDFADRAGQAKAVVFGGDTAYLPKLAAFARGADVLLHEAMYGPGVDALVARVKNGSRLKEHLIASHTMVEDAGRIATAAGVGRLVLNHLIPADDPDVRPEHWRSAIAATWSGPLDIGRDGLVIEI
jgi:ribonuclease BN (tRNA processing enzyme)